VQLIHAMVDSDVSIRPSMCTKVLLEMVASALWGELAKGPGSAATIKTDVVHITVKASHQRKPQQRSQ
jgi:hypothetical protein